MHQSTTVAVEEDKDKSPMNGVKPKSRSEECIIDSELHYVENIPIHLKIKVKVSGVGLYGNSGAV